MSRYRAARGTEGGVAVVRLTDAGRETEAAVAVGAGNLAYELKVRARNYIWFPFADPGEFLSHPRTCGVPFLAPWANRIDGDSFWVNGKRHSLNPAVENFHRDPNGKPIHGLLRYSRDWVLVEADADERAAWVTSRLDFGAHPDLLTQFPFAHTITMMYRLAEGVLEVETRLANQGSEPLPVAIGFHPYFQLHDSPRDAWKVHLAARSHMVLNRELIPTGEARPLSFADPHSLAAGQLDDVFGDLVRDGDGRAHFWVEGAAERVRVSYGPKYLVAVVYAPEGQGFVCFEPMAAVTNAFNLAHAGLYPDLQFVAPGNEWRESFWIEVA